ncbi:MarR family transcriptional regulator [Pseudonocardia abyssalis]|uniref:MarR family transcriptional regulator n=1 Tax=Pseudonocardia abyssalis TaxID=2792008 RepID=A0ABS6UUR9_9PSEU|nr:MarR family transcriptional regulator [Pseudonocardia abyssalis]
MTDAPVPPPLDLLLPQAGQAVDRLLRRVVAAHGLTPTSLGVLGVLARGRPAAHRELAAGLGVAPATLTPVVDALERAGQVVRVRDAVDRRIVRVCVTDAGRGCYLAAFTAVARDLRRHVPPPPPAVRAYLHSVLAALDGSADADGRPAPAAVVEVEPGREGAHLAVELDGQRHLGGVRPRMAEPDPAEAGR